MEPVSIGLVYLVNSLIWKLVRVKTLRLRSPLDQILRAIFSNGIKDYSKPSLTQRMQFTASPFVVLRTLLSAVLMFQQFLNTPLLGNQLSRLMVKVKLEIRSLSAEQKQLVI